MQILWVWILPHLGNQEDRKVTLKGKTNFSPCKRKRQQSSEATRALSVGLLMVSNWRNVIHQPPGAPAWLPTLPLEPSWACPFNHKLPALSTQNSRPPALLTTQDYCTCADGSAHTGGWLHDNQESLVGATTHHSHIQTHSHSSVLCLSPATASHRSSTSPGAPEKRGWCSGPGISWCPAQSLAQPGFTKCQIIYHVMSVCSPLLPLALSGKKGQSSHLILQTRKLSQNFRWYGGPVSGPAEKKLSSLWHLLLNSPSPPWFSVSRPGSRAQWPTTRKRKKSVHSWPSAGRAKFYSRHQHWGILGG